MPLAAGPAGGAARSSSSSSAAAAAVSGPFPVFLVLLVLLQWLVISVLLVERQLLEGDRARGALSLAAAAGATARDGPGPSPGDDRRNGSVAPAPTAPAGVVAVLLFRAPQWFHLRYGAQLHNALANMPADWRLQVFLNPAWRRESRLWAWHPNLRWLLLAAESGGEGSGAPSPWRGRVRLLELPDHLVRPSVRPKQVLFDPWFWEAMESDNVLLASGNGVFCGNHVLENATAAATLWRQLPDLDYLGAPSLSFYGQGGDATVVSFRNRKAMLRVLEHAKEAKIDMSKEGYDFFLDQMLKLNRKGADFRIATREQTLQFAGTQHLINESGVVRVPMVVAGTQERLSWDERESLLKHCPEVKLIFPSLHEPACFGARPKPEACRATICALRDPLPRGGC